MQRSFPTLIALVVLATARRVSRSRTEVVPSGRCRHRRLPHWAVLLSQVIVAAASPRLLLDSETLLIGFPLGFIILFFVRWQSATGVQQPAGFSRGLSMQELRAEIDGYESTIRRAIRIETGACIVVAVAFLASLWSSAPLMNKIGSGFTSAAALFIVWYLYRHARVRPIPASLGFGDSITAYRSDLERRRRMSRTYGWWYVMPLAIGIWLMVIAPQLQRPDSLISAALGTLALAAVSAVLVLVQRGLAQKAQQRIDQLDFVSERTQA